jgi:hypothetical protein
MVKRSFDYEGLDKVVENYKTDWVGFEAKALVENEENILLTDGKDNYALFEFHEPGVYYGHYLFSHHGARTLDIAKDLLGFFWRAIPAKQVRGLVPVEHKGAIRLTKALGFTIEDVIDTEAGYHLVASLNKEDYNHE